MTEHKEPMSASERAARRRARIVAEGGRQVAVMLSPEADAKLAKWIARGETITTIINKLLKRSKP